VADDASEYDSLELHVVSPVVAEEVDAATVNLADAWPGRIVWHRVRAASAPDADVRIESAIALSDPLGASIALSQAQAGIPRDSSQPAETVLVRHVRAPAQSADVAWASSPGRVLVVWPPAGAGDSVRAVASDAGAAVGRFAFGPIPSTGRVIARWSDGAPAAIEEMDGGGCRRTVAFAPTGDGDFAISPPVVRQVQHMNTPCGDRGDLRPTISPRHANDTTARLADAWPANGASPLAAWLLGAALALLLAELAVRWRAPAKVTA